MLQVVWFKKDFRTADHTPLATASLSGPVLPLYVYEPELMASPDYAVQHHEFINECLTELSFELYQLGSPLICQRGEITEVLNTLRQTHGAFRLLSHEETGNNLSYERDKRVAAWCAQHHIEWREFPTNGVVRALKSRDDWADIWQTRMRAPLLRAPMWLTPPPKGARSVGILSALECKLPGADKPDRQRGGRKQAIARLNEFVADHLADYRSLMSSPLSAADACSRLSPYLTYGCLSLRELVQYIWQLKAQCDARTPRAFAKSLAAFESRLHWRCHFIQKFEDQPALEWRNMHSAFDGIRQHLNPEFFQAWATGETGYPMVDACMKMLYRTGWINFRMRAMLVSFSSYQLWQPWQQPALHLAREFLDYEPGIHYPQVQMQSGVTGINIIRIYNPVKQSLDQDPAGIFLRRWLPALRGLEPALLHQPWLASQPPRYYPAPIVDAEAAARHARDTLWALRGDKTAREESKRVLEKHGSRRAQTDRSPPKKTAPANDRQLGFKFDLTP